MGMNVCVKLDSPVAFVKLVSRSYGIGFEQDVFLLEVHHSPVSYSPSVCLLKIQQFIYISNL